MGLTRSGAGSIDISSLNIETGFIDLSHSIAYYNSARRWVPVVETSTTNVQSQVGAFFNENYTTITAEIGTASILRNVILTIEYTKKTD